MIGRRWRSPGAKLFGLTSGCLVLALFVVYLSTARHHYGMTLAPDAATVQLLALNNAGAPKFTYPLAVLAAGSGASRLTLTGTDIIEEPDVLGDRAALESFRSRQQKLFGLMQGEDLQLSLEDATGGRHTLNLQARPSRPLSSLPLSFWIQLVTGIGGFVIGAWVLVLRPADTAARCFMLTGTALMVAAFSAAVYSTRELALPAVLWRHLMILNHAGSVGFGFALAGLFMVFPQRLLSAPWIRLLVAGYLLWLLAELAELALSPMALMYPPVLLLSGLIIALIGAQWWRSRRQPQARAALRWLGLATFFTITLFLALAAVPALFNVPPLISQGNAFGFFLILYAGFALGLRRHRLFELDRWAFHVLLWVLAGLALIVLDFLFLRLLGWQQEPSLLVSLLACGFLYLPLRGWLWRRLVERPRLAPRELFNHIIEVALAPSKETYITRWRALLERLFAPSHMEPGTAVDKPRLAPDGLALLLPPSLHGPALALALADKGRRLFTPADVTLAEEVYVLLGYANDNRNAWQQGAQEERRRIAQDLHDDLGSRLLTGLHQSKLPQVHDTIGLALSEMRSIVRGLAGQPMLLEQLLAELREECLVRCEAAGLALDWPPLPRPVQQRLDYKTYRQLLSSIRELLSNIIRHAGATCLAIQVTPTDAKLTLELTSDGTPFDGRAGNKGLGLDGLRQRINRVGGTLAFSPLSQGTHITLTASLKSDGLPVSGYPPTGKAD